MIKNKKKIDFVIVFSFVVMFLYTTYYLFTRSFTPVLQDYIMEDMRLTAFEWSSLTSAFSAAYGIFQIIGGYTMDKIGLNILCPLLLTIGSLLNYYFAISTNLNLSIYLRYGLGATFSVASTALLKYLSIVVPSHLFSKFVYGIYALVNFICMMTNTITFKNMIGTLGWRKFYLIYTIIGGIISLLLLISLNMFYKQNINNRESENKKDENVCLIEGLKYLLKSKNYLISCLFSVFISNIFYVASDGWLNKLVDGLMPNLLENQKSFACVGLYAGATAANFIGIAISFWLLRYQMLSYVVLLTAGLSFILYSGSTSILMMMIACVLIGLTSSAQTVSFDYTERSIPNKYLGLGFGVLNCCVMYLGCGLPQKLAGLYLDIIKGTSSVYLTIHYVKLFRLGYLTIILSLIFCLIFTGDKEKYSK
ncbi:hypothetical protein AB836_01190 [Rickettsiales bacterium (ex Bugula neritina AB1)]|nr:hypothetical protein AB836_01190 [Rickettsiales bacterium (ex Bugula neritina AB1)]